MSNSQVTPSIPRGIRNNNPGNVRVNPHIVWRGQSGVDPDGFLKFTTPLMGIRCMAMILRHYSEYAGCRSCYDYIERWAPPSENDTDLYAADVQKRMGHTTDFNIDLHTQGIALVDAIIWHENGQNPYSATLVAQAVHLSNVQ